MPRVSARRARTPRLSGTVTLRIEVGIVRPVEAALLGRAVPELRAVAMAERRYDLKRRECRAGAAVDDRHRHPAFEPNAAWRDDRAVVQPDRGETALARAHSSAVLPSYEATRPEI